MCVILHGLKKKHMRRNEVIQGMKANNSGFFIAVINHEVSSRETLRTLDENELLKVFDAARDDDEIVIHARIPSRGDRNLANVHGWESDGILFCHNMTLTTLDDMMKRAKWDLTDSEFFFRKVFIPYYRGLGPDAYKDGKFCSDLDNFVQHFVGYSNKFAFIMPDNKVVRYGNWVSEKDRKEGDEIAFWASNSTYVVHEKPSGWKPSAPCQTAAAAAADGCDDDDYTGYGLGYGRAYCTWGSGASYRKRNPKDVAKEMGKSLVSSIGTGGILRMAILDMCVQNIVQTKELSYAGKSGYNAVTPFDAALPAAFTDATMSVVLDGLPLCTDDEGVDLLAEEYAEAVSTNLTKANLEYHVPSASELVTSWNQLVKDVASFADAFSVGLDVDATDIEKFICAIDVPYRNKKGKWIVPMMDYADIVGDGSTQYKDCAAQVNRVLLRAAKLVREKTLADAEKILQGKEAPK